MEQVQLPRPGDFACVPVRGLGGLCIGLGQLAAGYWRHPSYARYRHTFVYLGEVSAALAEEYQLHHHGWTGPGVYCEEAMPGGARLRRLGSSAGDAWGMYGTTALWSTAILPLSGAQRTAAVTAALSKLGTPYSVLDYLSLITCHLHLHTSALCNFIQDSGHQICSQDTDWVWQQAGRRIFHDERWDGDVMPADLAYELVQARQGVTAVAVGRPATA
jgi:hypothetical protein